jgi:hypothetical protein
VGDGEDFDEQGEQMAGFRRSSDGVTARFARPEAAIIRDLIEQVVELIDPAEPASPDGGPGSGAGPGPGARPGPVSAIDELDAMVGFNGDDPVLPDDPALARLLPDAYRDDPDAAQEFRKYTEPSLRSAKVDCARAVLSTLPAGGGRVRLSAEQGELWLRSLNDVRLALGVRLGVTDDFEELAGSIADDDPKFWFVRLYQWLAYLQGSLVDALS